MNWFNLKDKQPGDLEEVLVWIDGHRGPSWRNNYALVAYYENGSFWEERHRSHKPLVGVIKWTYIDLPIN